MDPFIETLSCGNFFKHLLCNFPHLGIDFNDNLDSTLCQHSNRYNERESPFVTSY